MGYRNRTNTATATAEENTVTEPTTTPETAEATPAGETAPSDVAAQARSTRPSLEVGEIQVRKSTRTDFKTRTSPTESNPVYLAVKSAVWNEPTDIVVDADKTDAVVKLLRRSADPSKLNVGMSIASKPYPAATDDDGNEIEGKVVVTFAKHQERKTMKRSDASGTTTEG